jgi:hypothetical protein
MVYRHQLPRRSPAANIRFMNHASRHFYFYFFGFPMPLAEERKRRI